MNSKFESTTVTYSKPPHFLSNNPFAAYGLAPLGYATTAASAPALLRSTHHWQQSAKEPHPSDVASSADHVLSQSSSSKETPLIIPVREFKRLTIGPQGPHHTSPVVANAVSSAQSDPVKSPDGNENGSAPTSAPPTRSIDTNGITVNLLDKELWTQFSDVGNEMIVTRPGRRFFPGLLVCIRGLSAHTSYTVSLRVSSADEYRYKFINMKWTMVGESEFNQNKDRQIYRHPNSPQTGQVWMKKPISFKQVKITHDPSSPHGNVLLHTMHKYVMEIMVEAAGEEPIIIPLPNTVFMAVTAYQNTQITQLKIDNNPFAKGFRDKENAQLRQSSTMCSSALPLASLYGSSSGLPLSWQQMQQLARPISSLPVSGVDSALSSQSASLDEYYPKQSGVLPTLPTYSSPTIPLPHYCFRPTANWPLFLQPSEDCC